MSILLTHDIVLCNGTFRHEAVPTRLPVVNDNDSWNTLENALQKCLYFWHQTRLDTLTWFLTAKHREWQICRYHGPKTYCARNKNVHEVIAPYYRCFINSNQRKSTATIMPDTKRRSSVDSPFEGEWSAVYFHCGNCMLIDLAWFKKGLKQYWNTGIQKK